MPKKNKIKKICVFIGSRANYSSIKSVMKAIKTHPKLKLQLVLGASATLDRFGDLINLIREDGFAPDFVFNNLIEGANLATMAKSTGIGLIDASSIFDNLKPEMVVVVGDRFEMMSVTLAAAYMNIRIVHTMGGEVTGTIDESIRHAITKFAHVHFPANEDAKKRIIKMGEAKKYVFNVGGPRIDLIVDELKKKSNEVLKNLFKKYKGVGKEFDLINEPFLLVSQHSVTTEFGSNRTQIEETLKSLNELKINTIMLWPNADAGSDDVSTGIRVFRENNKCNWLYLFKNLPIDKYIHLMNMTKCLIGNSSSGIRDSAIMGTPVVNVGTRQNKRKRGKNVIQADHNSEIISKSIKKQINYGKYKISKIYGDGSAGRKIANILADCNPPIQKKISY